MTQLFYTGVGSRETPPDVLNSMYEIALRMEQHGYILRTGGAVGADQAFRNGAQEYQIYSPYDWHERHAFAPDVTHKYSEEAWQKATLLSAELHPAWGRCGEYARRLLTRNTFQVMGCHMVLPSQFLVCWTPDGATHGKDTTRATGGTGQTIRVASHFNIPVFNLNDPDSAALLWKGIS